MTVIVLCFHITIVDTVLDEGHAVQPNEIGRCLSVVPLYKGRWWRPGDSEYRQPAHPIELVVVFSLDGKDEAKEVLDECIEFVNSEVWYAEQGIPWRGGYLLYGVPWRLHLKPPLYCLSLSGVGDEGLPSLLQEMGDPPTVPVLEDVDRAGTPAVLPSAKRKLLPVVGGH